MKVDGSSVTDVEDVAEMRLRKIKVAKLATSPTHTQSAVAKRKISVPVERTKPAVSKRKIWVPTAVDPNASLAAHEDRGKRARKHAHRLWNAKTYGFGNIAGAKPLCIPKDPPEAIKNQQRVADLIEMEKNVTDRSVILKDAAVAQTPNGSSMMH